LPGHTPEHPGLLEFVIGMSTGARRATAAINAVTMLAASPAYASSQSARQGIPIPPGEEARAAEILAILQTPAPATVQAKAASAHFEAASPHVEVAEPPVLPQIANVGVPKKAPALSGGHHDPQSLRGKAKRWLMVTIVLLVGGLGLFLVAGVIDDSRFAGSGSSSLTTFIDVVGFLAWVASPATGVWSVVQWFRSRRLSHT
jgi:hypothetical protein